MNKEKEKTTKGDHLIIIEDKVRIFNVFYLNLIGGNGYN